MSCEKRPKMAESGLGKGIQKLSEGLQREGLLVWFSGRL
jgi:hypothetical protein